MFVASPPMCDAKRGKDVTDRLILDEDPRRGRIVVSVGRTEQLRRLSKYERLANLLYSYAANDLVVAMKIPRDDDDGTDK